MNQHHFKRISQAVVILALNSLYVACSDSAEFKGQAKNAAASSPSCTVEVTGQNITLGQTIKATLKSSATGVLSSTLNNLKADLGNSVDFTPTSEGVFKIEGLLRNSAGSGTCQVTVNVGPALNPAPVAPSCSLALTRQSPSSGTCNAVISSTGGPIVGNPSITGSAAMTSAGKSWTTTVPCSVAGATITAEVTGENNVVRNCSKGVAAIPAPNCTITAMRTSASSTSCNVTVTSTGGPVTGNPSITGAGAIAATATGWTTSATCAAAGQTITSTLTGANGTKSCNFTVSAIPAPSCTMSATRQSPTSTTCNVTVNNTGGPVIGNPNITGAGTITATDTGWTTSATCAAAGQTITSTLTGANGNRSCSASVPPISSPSCTMTATRQSPASTTCNVTVTKTGGPVIVTPSITGAVIITATDTGWTTSAPCIAAGQIIVSNLTGSDGTTGSCNYEVPAIPAPSCTMTATRQSPASTTCNVTVTNTGGPVTLTPSITGAGTITASATGWTTSAPCIATGQTIVSALTGVNGTNSCFADVPAISVCTINPNYNPEAIGCEINVKNPTSIWWNTSGFDGVVSAFTDSSASWISPPNSVTDTKGLYCPTIPSNESLIYVSHINISQTGSYTIEGLIDDSGSEVWLWPDGDPNRQITYLLTRQTQNLNAGKYVVVAQGIDTGTASGMVLSIKNSTGTVIHNTHKIQNQSNSWCIFRTASTVDPKTFVPEVARCRKCFGAP